LQAICACLMRAITRYARYYDAAMRHRLQPSRRRFIIDMPARVMSGAPDFDIERL